MPYSDNIFLDFHVANVYLLFELYYLNSVKINSSLTINFLCFQYSADQCLLAKFSLLLYFNLQSSPNFHIQIRIQIERNCLSQVCFPNFPMFCLVLNGTRCESPIIIILKQQLYETMSGYAWRMMMHFLKYNVKGTSL